MGDGESTKFDSIMEKIDKAQPVLHMVSSAFNKCIMSSRAQEVIDIEQNGSLLLKLSEAEFVCTFLKALLKAQKAQCKIKEASSVKSLIDSKGQAKATVAVDAVMELEVAEANIPRNQETVKDMKSRYQKLVSMETMRDSIKGALFDVMKRDVEIAEKLAKDADDKLIKFLAETDLTDLKFQKEAMALTQDKAVKAVYKHMTRKFKGMNEFIEKLADKLKLNEVVLWS